MFWSVWASRCWQQVMFILEMFLVEVSIHINCWVSSQHGKLANICDFFSTWLTFPRKGFFPWVMCRFLGVMNTNDAGRLGGHRRVQITEFYMILLPFINLVSDTGFHSDFLWLGLSPWVLISSLFGYQTTELEGLPTAMDNWSEPSGLATCLPEVTGRVHFKLRNT